MIGTRRNYNDRIIRKPVEDPTETGLNQNGLDYMLYTRIRRHRENVWLLTGLVIDKASFEKHLNHIKKSEIKRYQIMY